MNNRRFGKYVSRLRGVAKAVAEPKEIVSAPANKQTDIETVKPKTGGGMRTAGSVNTGGGMRTGGGGRCRPSRAAAAASERRP